MLNLIQGDCLIESEQIESGSVDLILTDLPYGTMDTDGGRKLGIHNWDNAISPIEIFNVANRILRRNGRIILFSQEPYTTELISNAIPNIPLNYRMIWEKDNFANVLGCNKAPVSYFEDILVFSKKNPVNDVEFTHPLRSYFKDALEFIGLNLKGINNVLGHRHAEHSFYINSTQFSLCTEQTYNELIEVFHIDKMEGFKKFAELQEIDKPFKQNLNGEYNTKYPSTFNLWEGKKYKSNILKYKKDYNGYHPTQKPVLLLEDLIKTYSNEGNTIVDLTMGSGSTGVAAMNTGRNFIGIELDNNYFEISKNRLKEAQNNKTAIVGGNRP